MKKMTKRILALCLTVVTIVGLSACGATKFDAKKYVQSSLDAVYHQEYKEYAEMIKEDEDKAKQDIINATKKTIEQETAEIGSVTDEDKDAYFQVMQEIYKNTKYEVGEAKEIKDKNYEVTVKLYPMDVMTKFSKGITDKMGETFTETPSDSELMKFLVDYLRECNKEVSYGEPVDMTIKVTHDDKNVYTFSEEDGQAIEAALIPGV